MTSFQRDKMETIGRNDPCHCGSGKKYKKCCGTNESAVKLMEEQNEALRAVLQEFFENQPRPAEQKNLLAWKNQVEDLLVPLYGEEKSGGIIGDLFFFQQRVDIWNSFVEKKIRQAERPQIRQTLNSWNDPVFQAGEILSVTDYRARLRDLLSEEIKEIDVNESFPVETGNIALGFYLPDPRVSEHFVMALNSVTVAVDATPETMQKLRDMYRSSETKTVQEFYRKNSIAVYQMFSSGLQDNGQIPEEVLEAVNALEQFLIENDLKSDDLAEAFFHFIGPMPSVPEAAVSGAVQFGIDKNLLQLEWNTECVADYFRVKTKDTEQFAEDLGSFYDQAMANQDKEAEYAFEVGTNPKANELQNWQLLMHLKNTSITSENGLKRQMEYFHGKAYTPKTPAEEAQLLAYETYQEERSGLKVANLKKIQQLDAANTDGFLLTAETETDFQKREKLLKSAIGTGKTNFESEMDVPWLYVPNRPYLRALFRLGVHYWEQSRFEEAFDEFYRLLQLNPGDHQGARYLAISSLIALERFDEAKSLIGHYEEQYTDNAFYAWFDWSIERKKSLLSKTTQDLFLEAIDKNPYVQKYVENRPAALPYPKTAVITPRSPEEARLIWTFLAEVL